MTYGILKEKKAERSFKNYLKIKAQKRGKGRT